MSHLRVDRRAVKRAEKCEPWRAALIAIVLGSGCADACFADRGPQNRVEGRSAGGRYRLELNRIGLQRFAFTLRRGETIVAAGPIEVRGHDLLALVDDTGSYFLLHDEYEGLAVFDAQGRRLGDWNVDDLLTLREHATRPGR